MKIKYHKGAWRCPMCMWYSGVSHYKIGTYIRKCRNKSCRAKIMVTVKEISYERVVYKREITSQPVCISD